MVAHAANRNNARNKRMKAIDKDTVSAPNSPKEEGLEMALPQKDGATSHGETLATASGEWTSKKEVTGTSHEAGSSADLKSGMSSPWWTGTMGMPPLQKQMKLKEEVSETMSVEEAPMMKSTPLCIAWREEKQKAVQEKGLTMAIVVPMLQRIAKDAPEYIMPSKDWTKYMRYVAGQRRTSQLYLTQALEAEILLSEAFDKLEPPKGIDEAAWEGFKGHAIYMERRRLRNGATTKGQHHVTWRNFSNGIRRVDIQEGSNRDQP